MQIKLARIQADVGLYKALGGGWVENAEDATQPIPASASRNPPTPAPRRLRADAPAKRCPSTRVRRVGLRERLDLFGLQLQRRRRNGIFQMLHL